ncbi:uncharacterized protein [Elaeis guineensis]|uniref:Uncharacterized protein LOC105053966 n=1 Tax=Elaeis guineensis var. tenera TaxID=51953 RepID=A0A6J0PP63_ELAGV|nr:uncharacterized protein LOC105053966 [Elaeis guineensis]
MEEEGWRERGEERGGGGGRRRQARPSWEWGSHRSRKSGTVMPFKAFSIATLFVGAGATAVACIHTVDDVKEVGAGIRR